ncbi:UNVERIFIED_CONTAM: hypothetical protein GTU68_063522 [Idotea baltica]|nr:hypothetical protein [Idotea baltica]
MNNKNIIKPRTLKGFRDILPPESNLKSSLISKIKNSFESYGYQYLETPHLEYLETLSNETEGEISKQLFKFTDNGDREVCLRFDLTVPFARSYVQNQRELGSPFKRYSIGNVFRGEKPQKGRYREFTQCDIDFVGTKSIYSDIEVINIVSKTLQVINAGSFSIKINHRLLLDGFFDSIDCKENSEVLRILDKLDKIGIEKVSKELSEKLSFSNKDIDSIFNFIGISNNDFPTAISKLKEISTNEKMAKAISELEKVFANIDSSSSMLDLSIARGLGYYTGIVFEAKLVNSPEVGTIAAGGRYDDLTKNFSKDDLSGVGGSIGIDRLMSAMDIKNSLDTSILITFLDEKFYSELLKVSEELRSLGFITELYPEVSKLKKQFQYADRRGYQRVLIFGNKESENQTYTIKNLLSGNQKEIQSLSELTQ